MDRAKEVLREVKELGKEVGLLEKSTKLKDLIKAVRACKTAAEERALIAKEAAAMRAEFRAEDNTELRPRAVAKLMFMHMLGYPTHFGQMECLKLISGVTYAEKRMGYLGLTLLLDERAEVLMLVTNSIQNDLKHKDGFIAGLALCALAAVASPEMARDLAPDCERLFRSENAYVRKKAPLAAVRIIRKVPELAEGFFHATPALLKDRHHGVLLGGVVFARELCRASPDALPMLRREVPTLVAALKALVSAPPGGEHDVGGVSDPFLQVAILRLLRTLGSGEADLSDEMSDVLAAVASSTDVSKNAGTAVLYESVRTILGVESVGSLRVMAINVLGKFLQNRDNNSRYVALASLSAVIGADPGPVQRHRAAIVGLVKDPDVSIRRRALELVYGLVNKGNAVALGQDLVEYLRVADVEFKANLAARIVTIAAAFAPDRRWHLDTLIAVFAVAGTYVTQEAVRGAVVLIANGPELQPYAGRSLYRALSDERTQPALTQLAVWCLGEYGDLILPGALDPTTGNPTARLPDEPPLVVTELDLLLLLESLLKDHHTSDLLRAYVLTALAKLASRLSLAAGPRIKALLAGHATSVSLELQQRACEFAALIARGEVLPAALERMPPPDEDAWRARQDGLVAIPHSASSSQLLAPEERSAPSAADLLSSLDAPPPAAAALALADLLGDDPPPPPPAALLADLLGDEPPPPPPRPHAHTPATDPLADLLGGPLEAPFGGAFGPPGALGPPLTVFSREGVTVAMQASKPPGSAENETLVTCTYANASELPVEAFLLQAAVPRFMTLGMGAASGASVPPGGEAVTQTITVTNSQYGVKPLVMKLRINYEHGGVAVAEEVTAAGFPPGA